MRTRAVATLFLRIFLLLLVAFLVSSFLAFEVFFLRWAGAESDTGRRAGLGRGLYITRALAERESGRLELAARAGGGLCATLHLPLSS